MVTISGQQPPESPEDGRGAAHEGRELLVPRAAPPAPPPAGEVVGLDGSAVVVWSYLRGPHTLNTDQEDERLLGAHD
ncbi:hypothetical protein GCM10009756_24280 [Pseudokineococcus marinus]